MKTIVTKKIESAHVQIALYDDKHLVVEYTGCGVFPLTKKEALKMAEALTELANMEEN
jgi:hypothetical protein